MTWDQDSVALVRLVFFGLWSLRSKVLPLVLQVVVLMHNLFFCSLFLMLCSLGFSYLYVSSYLIVYHMVVMKSLFGVMCMCLSTIKDFF